MTGHLRRVALLGSVLVATASACGGGLPHARLAIVDASTGATRHDDEIDPHLVSSATWSNGDVLVWGRDRCDGAATLVALAPDTGSTQWSVQVVDGGSGEVSKTGELVVGVDGDDLVAWSAAEEGAQRWRVPAPVSVGAQVTADDDLVIGYGHDSLVGRSTVQAHDPATGAVRWSIDLPAVQATDVALSPDSVLVRTWGVTDGGQVPATGVLALRRSDGATTWAAELGVSEHAFPLLVSSQVVIVGMQTFSFMVAGEEGDELRDLGPSSAVIALDLADGGIRWRHDDAAPDPGAGAGVGAFAADDSIVVGRSAARLVVWDAQTGDERWGASVGASGVGDAWIAGGLVLATQLVPFSDRTHEAFAFDASDGTPAWTVETRRAVVDAAVQGNDLALVQSGEGRGCSS